LLLLGYYDDEQYSNANEHWPIVLPDEKKIIDSSTIKNYFTADFRHYYDIFLSMKYCGMPWGDGWLNKPYWVRQLYIAFTNTFTVVENYNIKKSLSKKGR